VVHNLATYVTQNTQFKNDTNPMHLYFLDKSFK